MPFASARVRKLSTHCAKGWAAVCANARPPKASAAAPPRAVVSRLRRANVMLPPLTPNRGGDTAAASPDLLSCGKSQEEPMGEIARRAVIAGAGAGIVGLVASAQAETKPDIQASEYWASKEGTKLSLYRKRIAPNAGEQRPVLFLVHGSSNSTRTSYDLTVPGKGEYSAMNVLAGFGFDVWTMDHDGYGRSGSSGNSSDIASGVEDLKAAMTVVMQQTGQQKVHFYGTSSGAIRAGAFAQAAPERVDRLVLAAFTYKGTGSPEIARRLPVAHRY